MQPPVYMRWPAKIVHCLRALFLRDRLDQELAEELRFHIEQQIADNIASGMNPEEARMNALKNSGGIEQLKEECRDSRGVRFIQDFVQDLRYGLRLIARTPVLSAVIVTILAIGIGSATAVYSLIDACLLYSKYPVVDRWDVVPEVVVVHSVDLPVDLIRARSVQRAEATNVVAAKSRLDRN